MKKSFLSIGDNVIETFVAISLAEKTKGLMYVTSPVPNMTFLYASPQINKFWMKDTPAKLDIVFSCKGIVTEICCGEPYSTKSIGSNMNSDMIVEFPFGTANRLGLVVGSHIELMS